VYKQILRDTFASVFEKKDTLFKALIVPTILLVILHQFTSDIKMMMNNDIVNYYIFVPSIIFIIIFNITIAITTHRILLLGNDSVPKWGLFKLSNREFNFAWNFILLILLIVLITAIFGLFLFLGFYLIDLVTDLSDNSQNIEIPVIMAISFVVSLFVMSSVSLVFPSIATSNSITFIEAWRLAKKYRLLCFVTVIVFPGIFGAVFGFVYGLVIEFFVKLISPEFNVLFPLLDVFISVFTISALSHTYKYLIGNNSDSFFEDTSKKGEDQFPKEVEKVEVILQKLPQEDNK